MPKVYIAGAKIPTGGAYMAYHIGRLLTRHFGYEPVDVHIYDIESEIFSYDTPMKTISVADMERSITADDVMVVNPAFSQFLFGLTLPGRKIMYVQDFRTFLLLDCHFDLYVSVSHVVSRYLHALYGMVTKVIPAFIDPPEVEMVPWEKRPEGSALVYIKNPSREHQTLLKFLEQQLSKTAPHIDVSQILEGRGLSHADFIRTLASVRYLVNFSLAEGFGLVPLEAMSVGTMVTGVDGLAGGDYMQHGVNSFTGNIRDLRPLPSIIKNAFEDEALAKTCIANGFITAQRFGYEAFKTAWLAELSTFLGRKPDA